MRVSHSSLVTGKFVAFANRRMLRFRSVACSCMAVRRSGNDKISVN